MRVNPSIHYLWVLLLALCSVSMAAEKPVIEVLGTGGTIAGTQASAQAGTGYKSATLTVTDMIMAIPGVQDSATVTGVQIANVGSQDMTHDIWLTLAAYLNKRASASDVDGFVITHGTDSLEETAYFLHRVYTGSKPVALTAAMRPADAVSADGPGNMLAAIKAAASPGLGGDVFVVMNGRFHHPRFVSKRHTENPDAIRSVGGGLFGEMVNGRATFYPNAVCRPAPVDVSEVKQLPPVPIYYMHVGHDPGLIDVLVERGSRGIVTAGYGNGNTGRAVEMALVKARRAGVMVVRSSKVGDGTVSRNVEINDDANGFVAAYDLSPQKARIELTLVLVAGIAPDRLQQQYARDNCAVATR